MRFCLVCCELTDDEDCICPECQEYVIAEVDSSPDCCPGCERPRSLCECLWSCPLCGRWEEDCKCEPPF